MYTKLKNLRWKQGLAVLAGLAYSVLTAALALLCTEWIQRGTLQDLWSKYISYHEESFFAAGLLLWLIYGFVFALTRWHPLAVLVTGCAGCIPATVTFFKLQLRSEPFFPWDLAQASEAADVVGTAGLSMQYSMAAALLIFAMLIYIAFWLPVPKRRWFWRIPGAVLFAGAAAGLVGGVFLSPERSQSVLKVTPDMWYQARYYRNYGVITGFLTNIQTLKIDQPENYGADALSQLVEDTENRADKRKNMFPGSYGSQSAAAQTVQQPDIIYIMDESFWDAAELEEYGVEFDRELTPNLTRLREQAAYGKAYSPSFGGGTCDVEFEALTGYSKEFLPAGCKPYQQHVTSQMESLPNYLKKQGYQTAAIHGYYKRFWSRNTAYPNLGLDTFVGLEDMQEPEKKRYQIWKNGLVTDAEMARQIETLYEDLLQGDDSPVFLHAVTMQNHTSYTKDNYPDEERVKVLSAPAGIDSDTLGALEDFATGVWEADAMLGQLTEYYESVDRPVILVFWGDHYNPIGSNLSVYTATGYASNDSQDPALHGMPLLIWSNYWQQPVDLGTIGAYEISPAVTELYGLDRPLFFEYLTQQMQTAYRSRTLAVTIETDGTPSDGELTEEQSAWFKNHWLWQYDLMFGKEYSLNGAGYRAANQSKAS